MIFRIQTLVISIFGQSIQLQNSNDKLFRQNNSLSLKSIKYLLIIQFIHQYQTFCIFFNNQSLRTLPTMLSHLNRKTAKRIANGVKRRRMMQRMSLANYLLQTRTQQEQEQEQEEDDNFPLQKPLDFPIEFIGLLSPKKRMQLREQYSNMPAYLFMSQKQKKKFFEKKNQEYRNNMSSTKDKVVPKDAKKVNFREKFQVKLFRDNQKVNVVSQAKCFEEKYNKNHFS